MRPSLLLILLLPVLTGLACSDDDKAAATGDAATTSDAGATADFQHDDTGAPDTSAPETGSGDTNPNDAESTPRGWSTLAPMPAPRQETSVLALGDAIWVLGGFNDRGAIVPTVEVYTPATDSWRQVADLPVPMHHSNAAVVDGKIFLVGFLVGVQFIADGRAYAYDPDTDAWTERAPMPAGTERGGSGVAAIDGRIYVAGGLRRGAATRELSAYDPRADAWESLPDLPSPRDHMAAAAIDGLLIIASGRSGAIASHTTRVDAYDPVARAWSPRADIPSSRGGVAAATLNGQFYVFGGEGNADDPSGVFNNAEVYDLAADRWTVLDPMPVPRHGNGAAAVGDTIYIPGGADVQAFGAVATHEAYTP